MSEAICGSSALSWLSNKALWLVLIGLGAGILVFGKWRSQEAISLIVPNNSSTVRVEVRDYPNDFFPVQFPEVVEGDGGYLLGPEVSGFRESDARWQHPSLHRWVRTYTKTGVGQYAISIDARGDEIDMEWRVRNLSNKQWLHVSATPEVDFSKAPDFYDPAEARTFIRIDRQWVTLKSADHSEGAWANQWYVPGNKQISQFMQSIRGSKSSFGLSQSRLDNGLVAVITRDGRMVMGQTFDRVQYICHSSICVHPAADFGDIPSGKEVSAVGKIYFIRGNLDDLLRRVRQDFPSTIE